MPAPSLQEPTITRMSRASRSCAPLVTGMQVFLAHPSHCYHCPRVSSPVFHADWSPLIFFSTAVFVSYLLIPAQMIRLRGNAAERNVTVHEQ